MSRSVVNLCLDCLLLGLFLALSWVTAVLRFAFPPGPAAGGWTLWGRDFVWWSDLQFAILCVTAFAILLHVMLHWTWVCGVVASHFLRRRDGRKRMLDDGTRTLFGVGLLILLLNVMGLALAAAVLLAQGPP